MFWYLQGICFRATTRIENYASQVYFNVNDRGSKKKIISKIPFWTVMASLRWGIETAFIVGPFFVILYPSYITNQQWSPTTMLANTLLSRWTIFFPNVGYIWRWYFTAKMYHAYYPVGQSSDFAGQIQMSWRANLWPTAISPALRYVYRLNKNATVEKKFNLRFRIIPEIVEGRLQPVKTFRTFRLHIPTDAFALDFCLDDVVYKVYSRRRRALWYRAFTAMVRDAVDYYSRFIGFNIVVLKSLFHKYLNHGYC